MAVLLYDYFLRFDAEKRLVWPSRWGIGKTLYLLVRYSPFLDMIIIGVFNFAPASIMPQICASLLNISIALTVFGFFLTEVILSLRTWVIWDRDRTIGIWITLLHILFGGMEVTFVVLMTKLHAFTQSPIPELVSCWLTEPNQHTYILGLYISLAIGGAGRLILTILTLFRGRTYLCQAIKFNRTEPRPVPSLACILYRDGVIYFIYSLVLCLATIFVVSFTPYRPLTRVQRVLTGILTTQMLLNLREAANPVNEPTESVLDEVLGFT